jgi:plasmid stabilization system protein ParE
MTADQAVTAVAAATANCEAIRSNLLELDGAFGKQLLEGVSLTGRTKSRWDAASADLAVIWELFTAYSAVVEQAAQILRPGREPSASELAQIVNLLNGSSIHLVKPPPPLARRHITDNGRTSFTPSAAVRRMNELFSRIARLVTTAETTWNEVTSQLDAISDHLERIKLQARGPQGTARAEAVAAAEAELRRLRQLASTDLLEMSRRGRVDSTGLEDLRRSVQEIAGSAESIDPPGIPGIAA